MSDLQIPVDQTAEEALAGVAVSSARGYALAAERGVTGALFYLPRCRRVFEASASLANLSGIDDESIDQRLREASRLAAVPLEEVQRLRDARPVMFDKSGSLARRVLRAHEARRAMTLCDTLYTRLGSGERLDVVLEDLAPHLRQLGISA